MDEDIKRRHQSPSARHDAGEHYPLSDSGGPQSRLDVLAARAVADENRPTGWSRDQQVRQRKRQSLRILLFDEASYPADHFHARVEMKRRASTSPAPRKIGIDRVQIDELRYDVIEARPSDPEVQALPTIVG
jgi:hypothetical protein